MNSRESVQTANLPNLQSLQDQALDTARAGTDAGYAEGVLGLNEHTASITATEARILAAKFDQSVLDEVNAKLEAEQRAERKAARKAKRAVILAKAAATTQTTTPAHVGAGSGGKQARGSVYYYTEALALQILRLVEQAVPIADYELFAGGVRTAGIGSRVGVPSHVIHNWLRNRGDIRKGDEHLKADGKLLVEGAEFGQAFARAREIAADHLADRMLALADHAVQHPGASNAARVAADILRWQAIVRYRTRYGEPEGANKPAPQVLISIGSHSPAAPKLVGASSVAAQIEHSQPRSVVNTPGKSATRVIGPTDTGSVSRGGVTIQAQVTGAAQAGQGPRSGEGAPLGA